MNIVIYTQRVEVVENYNERRDCSDQRIADFIYTCGYLPIPIPNNAKRANLYIEKLNPKGIVLTGGNSLIAYGGNAPERDELDKVLIEIAIEKKVPLYGFCRGMQSILSYFGNNLINVSNHVAVKHNVIGKNGRFKVNSYHNQACVNLDSKDELSIVAQSEDGIVEMIQHKYYSIVGVMWHPEREYIFCKEDIELVKRLFN